MGFNDKFALQTILNGPCPLSSASAVYANLWNIQAPLKKSAVGFISKIIEAHLENTGSSSQPLPCKPERVGGNSKHGGTAARHVLEHIEGCAERLQQFQIGLKLSRSSKQSPTTYRSLNWPIWLSVGR
jgi:hypothetical protein